MKDHCSDPTCQFCELAREPGCKHRALCTLRDGHPGKCRGPVWAAANLLAGPVVRLITGVKHVDR